MSHTLNISFNPVVPPPVGGYRVSYWSTANPSLVTSVVITATAYSVPALPDTQYSGTVEPVCGDKEYGPAVPFTASIASGSTGINAYAQFTACTSGNPVDHLTGYATFSPPPTTQKNFRIDVVYTTSGNCAGAPISVSLFGTVAANQNFATINDCPAGTTYPVGAAVCTAVGVIL